MYYYLVSEKDSKKPKHGAEAIAAGEGPDRKLYRLRCNDVCDIVSYFVKFCLESF